MRVVCAVGHGPGPAGPHNVSEVSGTTTIVAYVPGCDGLMR